MAKLKMAEQRMAEQRMAEQRMAEQRMAEKNIATKKLFKQSGREHSMSERLLELWLVRHGETAWNKERRIQGHKDVSLNEKGITQAERLKKRIGHESFDLVYSSDLARAQQTAKIVFPKLELKLDKRLREISLGIFEGKTYTELNENEQKDLSVWYLGPFAKPVPDGESNNDLRERALAWLADLPKEGRVIAFTHGGTINTLLQCITGRPQEVGFREAGSWGFKLSNTSISKLALSDTYRSILGVNDAAHLE